MIIVNEIKQFITIFLNENFSFEAQGQRYTRAKLLDVKQGNALIETKEGTQEAIDLKEMKLAIKLNPAGSIAAQSPPDNPEVSRGLGIGFPLEGTNIKAYSHYLNPLYNSVLYSQSPYPSNNSFYQRNAQISAVTVVTINKPVVVEVIQYADGSQGVNIYDQNNYPGTGVVAGPPPASTISAFIDAPPTGGVFGISME